MKYDNCEYCDGKVIEKRVKVNYWHRGKLMVIENVPTGVCINCGERYYDASIVKRMEKIAKERNRIIKTITTPVAEYG